MYGFVLYGLLCIVLYGIALYGMVLYCFVFVLVWITLNCLILDCIGLGWVVLFCMAWYRIVLDSTPKSSLELNCTVLDCIVLCCLVLSWVCGMACSCFDLYYVWIVLCGMFVSGEATNGNALYLLVMLCVVVCLFCMVWTASVRSCIVLF